MGIVSVLNLEPMIEKPRIALESYQEQDVSVLNLEPMIEKHSGNEERRVSPGRFSAQP